MYGNLSVVVNSGQFGPNSRVAYRIIIEAPEHAQFLGRIVVNPEKMIVVVAGEVRLIDVVILVARHAHVVEIRQRKNVSAELCPAGLMRLAGMMLPVNG